MTHGRFVFFELDNEELNDAVIGEILCYDLDSRVVVPLPGIVPPERCSWSACITAVDADLITITSDGRYIVTDGDFGMDLRIGVYDRATASYVPLPGIGTVGRFPSLRAVSGDARYLVGSWHVERYRPAKAHVYDRIAGGHVPLPGVDVKRLGDTFILRP